MSRSLTFTPLRHPPMMIPASDLRLEPISLEHRDLARSVLQAMNRSSSGKGGNGGEGPRWGECAAAWRTAEAVLRARDIIERATGRRPRSVTRLYRRYPHPDVWLRAVAWLETAERPNLGYLRQCLIDGAAGAENLPTTLTCTATSSSGGRPDSRYEHLIQGGKP